MPRKRLTAKRPEAELSPELKEFFETGEMSASGYLMDIAIRQKIWTAVKKDFLKGWIIDHPGTRPWAWWKWDSPEPRKRIGGIGDPSHEHLKAILPHYEFGLPTQWVTKFDEEYYNGRARDIHRNLIPSNWKLGDFEGRAIDARNPPTFESEASYLLRLKLLVEGEKILIPKKAWQPERISPREEP